MGCAAPDHSQKHKVAAHLCIAVCAYCTTIWHATANAVHTLYVDLYVLTKQFLRTLSVKFSLESIDASLTTQHTDTSYTVTPAG